MILKFLLLFLLLSLHSDAQTGTSHCDCGGKSRFSTWMYMEREAALTDTETPNYQQIPRYWNVGKAAQEKCSKSCTKTTG